MRDLRDWKLEYETQKFRADAAERELDEAIRERDEEKQRKEHFIVEVGKAHAERDDARGLIGAERDARRIAGLARDDARAAAEAECNERRKAEAHVEELAAALRGLCEYAYEGCGTLFEPPMVGARLLREAEAALVADEPSGEPST